MKAGNTAYLATFYGEQPGLARGTIEAQRRHGHAFYADEWVVGNDILGPSFVNYTNVYVSLHPTLHAALAWLIERTESRLAEQEQEAAQTREALEELRGMLEETGP